MYLRLTFFKVNSGDMEDLRNLYNNEVIPAHKRHKGSRFVHLPERLDTPDEGISVTGWDDKATLDAYEDRGEDERMPDKFRKFFDGEPTLQAYAVTASSEPLLLRIF